MNFIVFTKDQAERIKGKYGIYSAIEPVEVYRKALIMGIKNPFKEVRELANQDCNSETALGMMQLGRTNATNAYTRKNKSAGSNNTEAIAIDNLNFRLLGREGGPSYDPAQLSFAYFGKGLTAGNCDIIVDCFEAYMDARKKGVIT